MTKTTAQPNMTRRTVPKEWKRVAGMLKGRLNESAVAYQRGVRKEWDARETRSTKRATQ